MDSSVPDLELIAKPSSGNVDSVSGKIHLTTEHNVLQFLSQSAIERVSVKVKDLK